MKRAHGFINLFTAGLVVAAVLVGLYLLNLLNVYGDRRESEGDTAGAARITTQWNQDTIKRAAVAASATKAARTEERNAAAAAMETEREAHRNAITLAQARAAAGRKSAAAAAGLSGHIAALDAAARSGGLPSAAACPGQFVEQRDAAIHARAVLGACSARHQRLAEDADATLDAATLKLDTALKYITIVAPK